MQQFLIRRVSLTLLFLFALSILTFLLVRSEHYVFHLQWSESWTYYEEPSLIVQYGRYVSDLLQGNWEKSLGVGWYFGPDNVVLERVSATLGLASFSLALSAVAGITLGSIAAVKRGTLFDQSARMIVSIALSTPIFWLGVFLMGIFVLLLDWLPGPGGSSLSHLILPAITLALLPSAAITKLTRSAMLTALDSEYVKLARIKGLSEWKIIWKHCLRNVAVSPLLSFGLVGGSFMTALVVTEAIFQWPGLGLLALQTIGGGDYHPMLSGVVLVLAGGFILCHLIYDLVRAFLDPRIRYNEDAPRFHSSRKMAYW